MNAEQTEPPLDHALLQLRITLANALEFIPINL
jgi:hypothetical protein